MKNKHLQKIVSKLVEVSFKDGKMLESQISKSIKILKSLPKYQAIESLSEYLKQLKSLQKQHTMQVESVIPLSQIQLKKLKKFAEKKAKITKVITQINPEILGGFILRVGDEVWDESIKDRINQVKEAIINAGSN